MLVEIMSGAIRQGRLEPQVEELPPHMTLYLMQEVDSWCLALAETKGNPKAASLVCDVATQMVLRLIPPLAWWSRGAPIMNQLELSAWQCLARRSEDLVWTGRIEDTPNNTQLHSYTKRHLATMKTCRKYSSRVERHTCSMNCQEKNTDTTATEILLNASSAFRTTLMETNS